MNTFFVIMFLLSIPSLIVGLIKPSIFKLHTRKSVGLLLGGIMVSSFVLFGITSTPTEEIAKAVVDQNNEVVELVATTTKEKEVLTSVSKPATVDKKVAVTQPVVVAPKTDSQYTYTTSN